MTQAANEARVAEVAAKARWVSDHHASRCSFVPLDIFEPGDVLLCTREAGAPMLRKGRLYRVARKVIGCHAYYLDGITDCGFWDSRFRRPDANYTRSGPIVRALIQPKEDLPGE